MLHALLIGLMLVGLTAPHEPHDPHEPNEPHERFPYRL